MVEIVVAQRMWQRRDTPANWTTENPILAAAELGIEIDPSVDPELVAAKCKVGDGITRWADLPYFGGAAGTPVEFQADATHIQWRVVGDPTWIDLVALADITGPPGGGGPPGVPGPSSSTFPTVTCDGGLADIQVGSFTDMYVPFGFTITKVTLLGAVPGSLQIDIRVCARADHPAGPTDTICGGTPPTLVGVSQVQDATLAGWTSAIPSDSSVRFIVTSSSGIKTAQLTIEGFRT